MRESPSLSVRDKKPGRVARALFFLTGYLPVRLIYVDGGPYLERYWLGRCFGLTFYIHRFIQADGDRHLRDHPWRALALVLSGGYTEERLRGLDETGPLVVIRRRSPMRPTPLGLKSFHRIARMTPGTWTLFIHARRQKGWGFLETRLGGFAPVEALTYYRPFVTTDSQHQKGWQYRSPKGRFSEREPLQGVQ